MNIKYNKCKKKTKTILVLPTIKNNKILNILMIKQQFIKKN